MGLSRLVNGDVSQDQVTRFLGSPEADGATMWKQVKPLVRTVQSEEGVLVVDDTIVHKPPMDENELISWHYDHTDGATVKGINMLSVLHVASGVSLPVSFQVVKKTETYVEKKTGIEKRKSPVGKNEI